MTNETLNIGKLPTHVALIMDGNRRWAKQHKLPVYAGHKKVVEKNVEALIEHAAELQIPYITFWAMSTENWGRNKMEIKAIMECFRWALKNKAQMLMDKGAKVEMIGDLTKFPKDISQEFEALVEKTAQNNKITTVFALNYGGRDEIVRAVNKAFHPREVGERHLGGEIGGEMSSEILAQFLDTSGMPEPDLIIRTGGEQRLSGFMLWQSEYSELYFTNTLMPDFGTKELDLALEDYALRQRRRGK